MRVQIALLLTAIFVAGFASPSSAEQMKLARSAVTDRGSAVQQQKLFGVMDDNQVAGPVSQAGFNVIKKTVWIVPTNNAWDNPSNIKGVVPLPQEYRDSITSYMADAKAHNERVILELYLVPKYGPPRGPSQMRGTCDLAKDLLDQFPETYAIEIGVEPNSHTFWWPQFNPDGTQASAAPYEMWLAKCYDKVKSSHPNVLVIGGSLSSRGEDDPHKPTSGTSPVLFLQKLCEAYKASGRTRPVMDWLDMHSYPDPEDQDPTVQHPYPSTTITIADYDKLEGVLGCFQGTAQPEPLVLWGEGGYNTLIPEGLEKKFGYYGKKPDSIRLVDETTEGSYVAEQIQMAAAQPCSVGFINFHFVDDPNVAKNWQSGFAYAPKQPKRGKASAGQSLTLKQSLPPVRKAIDAASGSTTQCESPGSP